ncbi:MAG: hypothetical protein KA234_10245, partial [Saprospiraceae bacterium]|nr:hypothetical protein [Saprospiraceae bacterium]
MTFKFILIPLALLGLLACGKEDTAAPDTTDTVIKVDGSKFLSGGLAEPVSIVSKTLSTGATVDCYKIVTKSTPPDHDMGPWCPSNISDDASKGGIWLEGGKVYDVDG